VERRNRAGDSDIFQTSGGLIGIGTTTPASNLDVYGFISAAAGYKLGGYSFVNGSALKGRGIAASPRYNDNPQATLFLFLRKNLRPSL
jgi:hypothetical protein